MSGNSIEKESRPVGPDGEGEGMGAGAVSSERNNSMGGETVKPAIVFSEAAQRWAEKGYPVFPLVPGGKTPATAHGFKDASSHVWAVSSSWSHRPDGNIGLATGNGLVVLDVDCKGGKDGWASLERVGLSRERLDELTFGVDTPSGNGAHYYFSSKTDVPCKVDVLGRGCGVDVRGVGGYVVVPPSIVDGKPYRVRPGIFNFWKDEDVPERRLLADWETVAPFLRKPEPSAPPSPPPPALSGRPSVLERASAYLRTLDPAVEGQGGSNPTLRAASALVNGFGLSDGEAVDLLLREYSPRCEPPWSEKEIRHKVASAREKGCGPNGEAPGWLLDGGEVPPAAGAPSACVLPVVEDSGEDTDTDGADEDADTAESISDVPLPPGIVGETARWILARCGKPYPPFAVLAALVVWAVAASRKARVQNQTPTLYVGALAPSSGGKDDPMRLAASILEQAGVSSLHFGGRLSSWNAGIEAFLHCWPHPVLFLRLDEAGGYVAQVSKSDFGIFDLLKESWSRTLGKLYPLGRVKLKGKETLAAIHHPALNIFLATQPSTLGEAVGRAQLEDGLLPRVLWAFRPGYCTDVETANLCRSCDLKDSEEGEAIRDRLRRVWNWLRGQSDNEFRDMHDLESRPAPDAKPKDGGDEGGGLPPAHSVWDEPLPFTLDESALSLHRDFMRRTQNRVKLAAEGKASPLGYLWGKAAENALRVALVLAVARCGYTAGPYTITGEEMAWSVRFVEASGWSVVAWARDKIADTPFERDLKRVLEFIRASKGAVKKSAISRRFRLPSRLFDDILCSLVLARDIEEVSIVAKGRGRPAVGYRLLSKRARRQ